MITGMVKQAFHAAVQEDFAPTAVLERIAAASRLFPDGKVRHRDRRAFQPGVEGDRICQRRPSAGTAAGSRRVGRPARTVGADDSPRTT